MLGDISFLKFVAANQGFPGKAQGRAEWWRVSPIPGCPTSDESPGPKTKWLQVFPSKAREGIIGRLKQQVCFCPRMRQTTVRQQGELKNQPPRRPLVSIQKPHASGKQHAFPFSLAYKGHPLILAQAAGPVGGAGAGLGLLPPRTGPKARLLQCKGTKQEDRHCPLGTGLSWSNV